MRPRVLTHTELVRKKDVILIEICVGTWAEVISAARTFNWPALTPPCPHLVVMPGSLVWADNQTFQCFLQQYVPTHSTCLFYVFSFPLYFNSILAMGWVLRR